MHITRLDSNISKSGVNQLRFVMLIATYAFSAYMKYYKDYRLVFSGSDLID